MSVKQKEKVKLEDYQYNEYYNLYCEYPEEEELIHLIQEKAFEYLSQFKHIKQIEEDKNSWVLIKCLNGYIKVLDEASIEKQKKFTKLFITLFEDTFNKFKKELGEYIEPVEDEYEDEKGDNDDEKNLKKNDEGELIFMSDLGSAMTSYTNISTKFSSEIIQNKGLKILFEYLKVLIDKVLTLENQETLIHDICFSTAGTIFHSSKLKHIFVQEWKEVNALEMLYNLADRIKDETKLLGTHLLLYATIAFIFEEKDLEKLKDIQLVVKFILNKVEHFSKDIK